MPSYPEVVSTIALVFSFGSFGVAAYNAFRDSPRLKVTSQFFDAWDYGPASFSIAVVNRGRRPVILRLLGGYNSEGEWGGEYLESEKGGIRLGEHERRDFSIEKKDTILFSPVDPDTPYVTMWIEDSLGNRHPVPKSREYLSKLTGS
jgi:hypothetical protein